MKSREESLEKMWKVKEEKMLVFIPRRKICKPGESRRPRRSPDTYCASRAAGLLDARTRQTMLRVASQAASSIVLNTEDRDPRFAELRLVIETE
jgi:hypothetical protein